MRKKASVVIVLIATLTMSLVFPAGAFAKGKTPLAKPMISATVLSPESVTITWKKIKNAKKYLVKIERNHKTVVKRYTAAASYKTRKLTKGYTYRIEVTALPSSASYNKSEGRRTITMPKKITRSMKGFSKTNAAKLLKLADSKVGCAYVSGGSGPRTFDCSGYVYYITKRAYKAGYTSGKLKRSSDAGELSQMKRMKNAKYVGRRYCKAQPGDIVFMGGHVAFYYGNGKLIHATNPKKGVAVTSTKWSGGEKRIVAIYRLPGM